MNTVYCGGFWLSCQFQHIEDQEIIKVEGDGAITVADLRLAICGVGAILTLRGWEKALLDFRKTQFQMFAPEIAFPFRELDKTIPNGAYLAMINPCKCEYDYCCLAKSMVNSWTASKAEVFEDENTAFCWLGTCSDCAPHLQK